MIIGPNRTISKIRWPSLEKKLINWNKIKKVLIRAVAVVNKVEEEMMMMRKQKIMMIIIVIMSVVVTAIVVIVVIAVVQQHWKYIHASSGIKTNDTQLKAVEYGP